MSQPIRDGEFERVLNQLDDAIDRVKASRDSVRETDDRLLSELVSRCCSGMEDGDRFYHAKDGTWWEWLDGRLRGSGPPPGYRRSAKRKARP